ncbi:MAG: hypothetical protein HKN37_07995 [Rhodothermales bacterium]|nr:hypothetical protein [Rhodothermales bacterium]
MSHDPILNIAWIDDYHGGDPLFVQSLARGLAARPMGEAPPILVHGGAERAERLLEAQGIQVEYRDGVPASHDPAARALIERAYREVNKETVAILTEFGVPAVGIQGCDRGLLTRAASGELVVSHVDWLRQIVASGAVSVVSALVSGPDVDPVPVGEALTSVIRGFSASNVQATIFPRGSSKQLKANTYMDLDEIAGSISDTDARTLQELLAHGIRVVLTDARSAFDAETGAILRISP